MQRKFSVIVPAFNAADTIGTCLQSLLRQSYPVSEIIVVDDGSIDKTSQATSLYPVKVMRTSHAGASRARNLGFSQCSGDIVLFAEADGIYDDKYVENIIVHFSGPKVGAVLCPRFPILDGSISAKCMDALWRIRKERYSAGKLKPLAPHVFSRSAFTAIGGYDEALTTAEEWDMGLRLKAAGYEIRYAPNAFFLHREGDILELFATAFRSALSKVYYKGFKAGGFGAVKTPTYIKHKSLVPWRKLAAISAFGLTFVVSKFLAPQLTLILFSSAVIGVVLADSLLLLKTGWRVVGSKTFILALPWIGLVRNIISTVGIIVGVVMLVFSRIKKRLMV